MKTIDELWYVNISPFEQCTRGDRWLKELLKLVGRGLRLCVNQTGNRMDAETCGELVHDINVLTVISNESYKKFVSALQTDIKELLYDRPLAATSEYFTGKFVKVNGQPTPIDAKTVNIIEGYLIANGYADYIL